MKRYFHNLRRLWSGAEWFYLSRTEWKLPVDDQMGPRIWVTTYYTACNTSACPHWYEERRRADTVHKANIQALLNDLEGDDVWIWTKEEFDARTKEMITDAVFKEIE